MKNVKMIAVKNALKVEAAELRELKVQIKNKQRSFNYAGNEQAQLETKRYQWRHKFIAYCELMGRSYEEIETNCREDNAPNMDMVERIKQHILGDLNG